MRVLITGGAGFIGSHVADRFLADGYQVRVIDTLETRVHPQGVPSYLREEVEWIKKDVRDRDTWKEALRDVDVVSHQAAYQDYMLDFSRFLTTNAVSTALLYEVLVEQKWRPRKVIIASSQSVYGEGQYTCGEHGRFSPHYRPAQQLGSGRWEVLCPVCGAESQPLLLEEDATNPVNQYAVSKLAGEQIGLGLGRLHGIPTVALRYSITQGPRQSLFNQYSGIIRIFVARALAGLPLIVYEDGLQTRDFVHVADVVDANFRVLEDERADFQSFNVGGGRRTTVKEFAAMVLQSLGSKAELSTPGQYRVGDNRHSISNIERLRSLGWEPGRPIAQNIQDFVDWVSRSGGVPKGLVDPYELMRAHGVIQGED